MKSPFRMGISCLGSSIAGARLFRSQSQSWTSYQSQFALIPSIGCSRVVYSVVFYIAGAGVGSSHLTYPHNFFQQTILNFSSSNISLKLHFVLKMILFSLNQPVFFAFNESKFYYNTPYLSKHELIKIPSLIADNNPKELI